MEPPSALPRGGRVPWQDLLLAVSLLTLWNPLTIAQVTVEPVPPSATEGKDVLLQANRHIVSYIVDVRVIIPGPAHSGRETVYPNGSLLFRNITLKDTGYYTLQIVDRNYEVAQVTGQVHEGSTTGFPVGSMVGITVGVLVGLALVATLGCLLLRTRTGRYDDISHTLILFCSCPQPGGRLWHGPTSSSKSQDSLPGPTTAIPIYQVSGLKICAQPAPDCALRFRKQQSREEQGILGGNRLP
uniref:Immunoglobulin subtype domain-containing protein n=1 Tax=Neovison vison TaxID=452646 RepID=A0A8C7BZX4_NEOVI